MISFEDYLCKRNDAIDNAAYQLSLIHISNGITSSGNGGVDQNSEYEGNDYEHAADDIERLLSSMARCV